MPHGNEITMRLFASGCCHTDVHIVAGEMGVKHFPIHPCHVEGTGIVHRLGELVDRSKFSIADRIGIPWLEIPVALARTVLVLVSSSVNIRRTQGCRFKALVLTTF